MSGENDKKLWTSFFNVPLYAFNKPTATKTQRESIKLVYKKTAYTELQEN